MIFIEIGGGNGEHLMPGAINLDPIYGTGEWKRKAQETPWPVRDGVVAGARARHSMEHIPSGDDRIAVMNEVHRVLAPGSFFEIIVPFVIGAFNFGGGLNLPDFPSILWPAIADPTHVSYWCPESFAYFDGTMKLDADYGIKLWKTEALGIKDGWEGFWRGSPVKD